MKNRVFLLTIISLFLLGVTSAWAGSYTIPNTFTSGTPAVAAEVNANFNAAKTAIDDNDSRVTTLENTLAGAAETTWTNAVYFTNNTPAVALSNTITIPDPGIVVAIATGFVFHDHTFGVQDGFKIELSNTTAGSSVSINAIGYTETRVPNNVATGLWWGMGYSITRTFVESTAGAKKYYINGQLASGAAGYLYSNHLTLLYFPASY